MGLVHENITPREHGKISRVLLRPAEEVTDISKALCASHNIKTFDHGANRWIPMTKSTDFVNKGLVVATVEYVPPANPGFRGEIRRVGVPPSSWIKKIKGELSWKGLYNWVANAKSSGMHNEALGHHNELMKHAGNIKQIPLIHDAYAMEDVSPNANWSWLPAADPLAWKVPGTPGFEPAPGKALDPELLSNPSFTSAANVMRVHYLLAKGNVIEMHPDAQSGQIVRGQISREVAPSPKMVEKFIQLMGMTRAQQNFGVVIHPKIREMHGVKDYLSRLTPGERERLNL